jgi:hypothetical protein
MDDIDWTVLPNELWAQVIAFLADPRDWTQLRASSKSLKRLIEQYGFGRIERLTIVAASFHNSHPDCGIIIQARNQRSQWNIHHYTLFHTQRVLKYLWVKSVNLTGITIQSTDSTSSFMLTPNTTYGYRFVSKDHTTPFVIVMETLLTLARKFPRAIGTFGYVPIFTPEHQTPLDLKMRDLMLGLLKHWKVTLKALTIFDQSHHLDQWIAQMEGSNLQELHCRTTYFQREDTSVVLDRDFQLPKLLPLVAGPNSQLTGLSLFLNGDRNNLAPSELLQICQLLRSLKPQTSFRLALPQQKTSMQFVFDRLSQFLTLSPWQIGLKELNLGATSGKAFQEAGFLILDLFPNLEILKGLTISWDTLTLAQSLGQYAEFQPLRRVTLWIKCNPTHYDHPDFQYIVRNLPTLSSWYERQYGIAPNAIYPNPDPFKGIRATMTYEGRWPRLASIHLRHEDSPYQKLVFSVFLYDAQECFYYHGRDELPFISY